MHYVAFKENRDLPMLSYLFLSCCLLAVIVFFMISSIFVHCVFNAGQMHVNVCAYVLYSSVRAKSVMCII